MNAGKILFSGLVAGVILWVVSFGVSFLVQALVSYAPLQLPGMRSVQDPVLMLFFLYPLVLGFVLAFVYGKVKESFRNGVSFGLWMAFLFTVPNLFVIYSSMNYPVGFFASTLAGNFIGFPLAGLLLAKLQR
ncbi:MAG: hypothetical protein HY917_03075 [Candidatus Diapherotrites archaeon]|nr:hypothetical protein [Candidatus Diapherotrites archaeon]